MPTKTGGCCKAETAKKQQQAIMVDGQRYTCEKCRKGHRTGTCNHLVDDNGNPSLLQKTNRAGRPNTTSKCRCPSSERCDCVKAWYLVVRIPKSEIEPGREGENNCRIVGTVVKPLRESNEQHQENQRSNYGGTLIASSAASSGHRCNCGDSCACTYCPEHPENQATHDHNEYLVNRNRPIDSVPHPNQQLIESSTQGCGGTAEVSYTCSSDSTAAGQEAMLSTIPLNDHKYHYQVYSGQYQHGGCASSCRCPGCITWRVTPGVKQHLLASGYLHEDCPPKCNCPGCWTCRERGGNFEFPVVTLEEFFSPLRGNEGAFSASSPSSTIPGQLNPYSEIPSAMEEPSPLFQSSPLTASALAVRPQVPYTPPAEALSPRDIGPYSRVVAQPLSPSHVAYGHNASQQKAVSMHLPVSHILPNPLESFH